jgi:hypothetical protein
MCRLLLLAVLLPLAAGASDARRAAADPGVVTGIVRSAEGEPLPAALVVLLRTADTTRVAAVLTAADGAFRIVEVVPGRYMARVSHPGYGTATLELVVDASGGEVDLGVLVLERAPIALQAVEVSAAAVPVTALADRNVYSTRDLPAGGSATDLLRSIPELDVGVEGSVTVRGAAPVIHINGRPAPMQGEALERFLRQLPADRVDRVEVIPEPPSRYEAAGEGGIVDIVLKRGEGLGLGGSVAAAAGTGGQRSGSVSAHYQRGGISLFGSGGAGLQGSTSRSQDLRHNLNADPSTSILQVSSQRSAGGHLSLELGAEARIRESAALWADASFGRSDDDADVLTSYTHLDHLEAPTLRYDRADDREVTGRYGGFALGAGGVPGAGRTEWSLELRGTIDEGEDARLSERRWLDEDGSALDLPPEWSSAEEVQDRRGRVVEATVARTWSGSGRAEIGYRGSTNRTRDAFLLGLEDVAGEGEFRTSESLHAGFVALRHTLGAVSLQVGLRGEAAETQRSLPLSREAFRTARVDLFPSAHLSTPLGAAGRLRLSYSRRVDRPAGRILNPATPALDPLNRQVGNPYLQPRYTDALSLTIGRSGPSGSLQLSPFLRRTTDAWDQVRSVDATGASTVSWENVATITSYGGTLAASLVQRGPLGGFMSVRGFREVREGRDRAAPYSGASTRFSVLGTLSVRASSALTFQGSATYVPPREVPQGRISRMVFSSFAVRQQLAGGRGTVHLSVIDPLALQRFTFVTRDPAHLQSGSSRPAARRAELGVSYSFGRLPERDRRREREEVADEDARRIR